MFFGVPIGPGGNFLGGADIMATIGSTGSGGLWANKTNRYMGLKFMINGSHHFGWARLTVVHGTATITGYAYETIPNKPIIAGKTSGFAVSNARAADQVLAPFHQRASLGVLALGTNGLNIWRRGGGSPRSGFLKAGSPLSLFDTNLKPETQAVQIGGFSLNRTFLCNCRNQAITLIDLSMSVMGMFQQLE